MEFLKIIKNGETKTVEFKETLPQKKQIIETVTAFSNTSGGKLFIGISKKGKIVGISREIDIFEQQDKIISLIHDSIYPNVMPEIYTVNIENKTIIVIEVFRGNLLPYFLKSKGKNNGTYIRVGATNRKASIENIIELERQKRNTSFDEEINYEHSLKKFELDFLKNEFKKIGKTFNQEKLKNLKLIKNENNKEVPTNALLILAGIFENNKIKCARFKGKTPEIFIDRKEFEGNIFDILKNTENFLKNHLDLKGEINGMQRTDTYEIPMPAIREALVNALIHRDYSNMGRDIKVAVFDHAVNIVSPGGFPSTITFEDIMQGRSEVRNKILARVFKELNYIEQWGTGINRIIKLCIENNLRKPIITEKGDFVDIILFRAEKIDSVNNGNEKYIIGYAGKCRKVPESAGKKLIINSQKDTIISYIAKNNYITSKIVQKLLDVKERRARDILKEMVEEKIILKIGNSRNTKYIIKQ